MQRKGKYYAVYWGDTLVCHGSSEYCADYLKVNPYYIRNLASQAHHKRLKNPHRNWIAIVVEELDEMGN